MADKQELLKKLKVLAEQGVGGEKLNAQKKLDALMKKYGISEEELSDDIPVRCEFKFKGNREKRLLIQVVYKVTNDADAVYEFLYTYSGRTCRTKLGCNATAAQKIEIDFLFDFYKNLYVKEEEFFYRAFIQKHRLFGELKAGQKGEEYDYEALSRMHTLMGGMSDEQPLKQIEAPAGAR